MAGVERTVHFLVATLPYSNMRYAVAMPGENAECLCSSLSMVFERMGGVPSVLVMDNATGAGHRDRDGEVTLTHVFASFASHHRMESMVFERMGGVPSVLVMDNATGAGHRDRDGEVTLTHVFASFASHHRMEVRFCNPYSSNEKGNGRTRSVF